MTRNELLKIVAQLQEEVKANTNILGGITHDAAAPTPGRSGIYEFTSAGVCSWLDGTPVVIGDRAIVVYYDTTYTYTYQENLNINIEQARSQATNKVPSSKLLDDELTALNTEIKTKASELLAATVYISADEYQTLIDNELVDPDVEYNIYEE